MSNIALRKRIGTTSEIGAHTYPAGTPELDIIKPTLVVHDGVTAGGVPLAHEKHDHEDAIPPGGSDPQTSQPLPNGLAGFMSATDKEKLNGLSAIGGYNTVQSAGSPLAHQAILNFSSDFVATDNQNGNRTDVAMSQSFQDTQLQLMIAMVMALA